MARLVRGIYERIIGEALEAELSALTDLVVERKGLRSAEAGDRLALHLAGLIEGAVDGFPDTERVDRGVALARRLVETLAEVVGDGDLKRELPTTNERVLYALLSRNPDGRPEALEVPLIPLLDTTLLTNAPGEPRVARQLITELA